MSGLSRYEVEDVEIACHVSGNGPPLLLVHGFPLDHTMWRRQFENLSRSFHVIAPDLRGYGQSSTGRSDVSMKQFASDLSLLLKQIVGDDPVCFCGLSMGGYIGWQFVRHHRAQLAQLVLCDTRAVADDTVTRRARRVTASHVLANGTEQLAADMVHRLFAPESLVDQPAIVSQTQQVIQETVVQTVADGQCAMAERAQVTDWISSIDVPTLVVVGEHDMISTPAEMRQIADAIPNAEYCEIQGAGHMAPLEKPAEFNLALSRFLA